jgi:hypothetical protein
VFVLFTFVARQRVPISPLPYLRLHINVASIAVFTMQFDTLLNPGDATYTFHGAASRTKAEAIIASSRLVVTPIVASPGLNLENLLAINIGTPLVTTWVLLF